MKLLFILTFVISTSELFSQLPFQAFFGNLHCHTGDSDGEQTPADAYAYARDSAGLDFLAVTDHVEQVDVLEWWSLSSAANNANSNGNFVAFAGYEWGSPLYGHCNQFNTSDLLLEIGWYYTDWDGFRQWIIDNYPSFGQFNHPAEEIYFTNWDDFAYKGAVSDSVFPLIEFQTVQQANEWYSVALSNGWHVSPVWNQDNHSADWGTKNDCRAGIWSTGLNRTALYDAIRKRRTFATMDKNASVWMDVCGYSMGSSIARIQNTPVHIVLNDGNSESYISIEIISQNGVINSIQPLNSVVDTVVFIDPTNEDWLYIKVTQNDSDMLWSAPVHFYGTVTGTNESVSSEVPDNFIIYNSDNFIEIERKSEKNGNGIMNIELFNTAGICVRKVKTDESFFRISTEGIPAGIYSIRVSGENNVYSKKIIIN